MLKQIIICTTIKIRRAPKRHDNIHRFSTSNHNNKDSGNKAIVNNNKAVVCDKGYDSEKNHVLVERRSESI